MFSLRENSKFWVSVQIEVTSKLVISNYTIYTMTGRDSPTSSLILTFFNKLVFCFNKLKVEKIDIAN